MIMIVDVIMIVHDVVIGVVIIKVNMNKIHVANH